LVYSFSLLVYFIYINLSFVFFSFFLVLRAWYCRVFLKSILLALFFFSRIGQNISTKEVGRFERLDVTQEYKPDDGMYNLKNTRNLQKSKLAMVLERKITNTFYHLTTLFEPNAGILFFSDGLKCRRG
jgi:hypothetical protein